MRFSRAAASRGGRRGASVRGTIGNSAYGRSLLHQRATVRREDRAAFGAQVRRRVLDTGRVRRLLARVGGDWSRLSEAEIGLLSTIDPAAVRAAMARYGVA